MFQILCCRYNQNHNLFRCKMAQDSIGETYVSIRFLMSLFCSENMDTKPGVGSALGVGRGALLMCKLVFDTLNRKWRRTGSNAGSPQIESCLVP